ncbi:hypothetical protein HDU67_004771 [Dinochytrium kinnereticum]|nr:hypothetical protein HDU67_004771 [Dinochytrium kinnereticum]
MPAPSAAILQVLSDEDLCGWRGAPPASAPAAIVGPGRWTEIPLDEVDGIEEGEVDGGDVAVAAEPVEGNTPQFPTDLPITNPTALLISLLNQSKLEDEERAIQEQEAMSLQIDSVKSIGSGMLNDLRNAIERAKRASPSHQEADEESQTAVEEDSQIIVAAARHLSEGFKSAQAQRDEIASLRGKISRLQDLRNAIIEQMRQAEPSPPAPPPQPLENDAETGELESVAQNIRSTLDALMSGLLTSSLQSRVAEHQNEASGIVCCSSPTHVREDFGGKTPVHPRTVAPKAFPLTVQNGVAESLWAEKMKRGEVMPVEKSNDDKNDIEGGMDNKVEKTIESIHQQIRALEDIGFSASDPKLGRYADAFQALSEGLNSLCLDKGTSGISSLKEALQSVDDRNAVVEEVEEDDDDEEEEEESGPEEDEDEQGDVSVGLDFMEARRNPYLTKERNSVTKDEVVLPLSSQKYRIHDPNPIPSSTDSTAGSTFRRDLDEFNESGYEGGLACDDDDADENCSWVEPARVNEVAVDEVGHEDAFSKEVGARSDVPDVDEYLKRLFHHVKDPIYRGAAGVIAKHEPEPYFLLQLFRNVLKLDTPYLRQRFLIAVDDIMGERERLLRGNGGDKSVAGSWRSRERETEEMDISFSNMSAARRRSDVAQSTRDSRALKPLEARVPAPSSSGSEFEMSKRKVRQNLMTQIASSTSGSELGGLKAQNKAQPLKHTSETRVIDPDSSSTESEFETFQDKIQAYVSNLIADPHRSSDRLSMDQISALKIFIMTLVHSQIDSDETSDWSTSESGSDMGKSPKRPLSPGSHRTYLPDSDLADLVLDQLRPVLDRRLDRFVGLSARKAAGVLMTEVLSIVTEGLAAAARLAFEATLGVKVSGESAARVRPVGGTIERHGGLRPATSLSSLRRRNGGESRDNRQLGRRAATESISSVKSVTGSGSSVTSGSVRDFGSGRRSSYFPIEEDDDDDSKFKQQRQWMSPPVNISSSFAGIGESKTKAISNSARKIDAKPSYRRQSHPDTLLEIWRTSPRIKTTGTRRFAFGREDAYMNLTESVSDNVEEWTQAFFTDDIRGSDVPSVDEQLSSGTGSTIRPRKVRSS